MDVEVELSDANSENHPVDPIEFGRLLGAVEGIAKRMEHWDELQKGLQYANEDIRLLTHTQETILAQLTAQTEQMKHLNGAQEKLRKVGLDLNDADAHKADQLYLRSARIRSERGITVRERVKTGVITALTLSATIWVLSTLWQARHTISL